MRNPHRSLQSRGMISWPAFALLMSGTVCLAQLYSQNLTPRPRPASETPLADTARNALAWSFARLIRDAIPAEYEKKKDWGRRKNITVGVRADGLKLERRKKPVKHGVWKHYVVKLVEPEENLSVAINDLRSIDQGRMAFKLVLSAKLDLWARAKTYQYGVHIIALEATGRTDLELELDCEVGVGVVPENGKSNAVLDPRVVDSKLNLKGFRLNRISNAKGPLVREIGEEIHDLIEKELRGKKLTAKLNKSIDKKRDRLQFTLPAFLNSSWWPLASLPKVEDALEQEKSLYR